VKGNIKEQTVYMAADKKFITHDILN